MVSAKNDTSRSGTTQEHLPFRDDSSTPTEAPHRSARLRLRPSFTWDYASFVADVFSSDNGRFHFSGLKPGIYRIDVSTLGADGITTALPELGITEDTRRELIATEL